MVCKGGAIYITQAYMLFFPYLPTEEIKLTPLPSSNILVHLLLSETTFSPLPLRIAEISSLGIGLTFLQRLNFAEIQSCR